jgi:DNA invertase Pin-like site-specific DNA recombinase
VKALGYVRVSTEEQGESGLGLAAQRSDIARAIEYKQWELVNVFQDVASGKSVKRRPELALALAALKAHEAEALIVAKLDRLSRSVVDFAEILERSRAEGWSLLALDLNVDTSTATGEMLANIVMSLAQWERRTIGERTIKALAEKKKQGVKLGRPANPPSADTQAIIDKLRREGLSWRKIAADLNRLGLRAPGGGEWSATATRRVGISLGLVNEILPKEEPSV